MWFKNETALLKLCDRFIAIEVLKLKTYTHYPTCFIVLLEGWKWSTPFFFLQGVTKVIEKYVKHVQKIITL